LDKKSQFEWLLFGVRSVLYFLISCTLCVTLFFFVAVGWTLLNQTFVEFALTAVFSSIALDFPMTLTLSGIIVPSIVALMQVYDLQVKKINAFADPETRIEKMIKKCVIKD